ncbi:MAG: 2,3-bisphosphoglycerate-independent phosphoglycerate mutase, partial [Rhodospirillaceae bacterium]|nr:2,3-bisphosphoglycerate-independent phosphoglycerate mutase [Rhodospirillaceae bacterium]
ALDPFLPCLFQPQHVSKSLGSLVADAGLIQLRIAETEKYAHVTYFFNGGGETVFAGEERVLVPSPRVATYDLQPEMSAGKVTDKLVAAIKDHHFDLVICNFANPDMVGHTGIFAAALKAVETVDQCLGRIADAVADAGGYLVVTADHGNIESMRDPITGEAHTAHTTNPVPLVIVNAPVERALRAGGLADLAPTLLDLLKLPQPDEMTGQSLLSSREQ